jgi:hypothetical protein
MQKRILCTIACFSLQVFSQYIYESNQSLVDLTNQTDVTWLTSGDDSISSAFNLGFDFTFYEQTFSTARMATNGCLHFGSSGTGCNDYTPDPLAQFNYTIYPFWTDLIAVDANAKMAAKNFNDKIVFGWYKMQEYYRQGSYNSFEVILWNNNTYDIRYGDLDIINHDVLIGEQGNSSQTYTYYFHDECNTGSYNGTNCYAYDWNSSDKNTNLEAGGSLYGEGEGIDCSNALNDSSCDGYEEAYLAQQCNLNALYSTSCSGYDQAYQEQQCGLDALYSTECSGYEQAYLDQQCGIDALYSTECSGYEQAYLDYECDQDSQYSPTCSGYIPEAAAIVVVQTSSNEYETYQIIENEVVEYNEPINEEFVEEFIFEETFTEEIIIDPIIDVIENYDVTTENIDVIDVFDAEELLEVFIVDEIIEEIEEFTEEEVIEEIIEEIIEEEVEELIVDETVEEEVIDEVIEEVVEIFEETPKGNSISSALRVVAQSLQTASDSYTKQNNIGNTETNQTGGISTTSSPSISDQILSATVQNNTVLQLSDNTNTTGGTSITITPLFTLDNSVMSDVQINNIQEQILSATSNVMTSSEADKIADQILANNIKEAQENIEEEQKESGEYADQTTLVAYLGYVPAFETYKDLELPQATIWYEPKDIYSNIGINDNDAAYINMANNNTNTLQTIINSQVKL